ncbi:MLP-like protein 28 [Neltuma alba]|uniref:MLP-like protein 28 n=1 Tax=Neltuma alba TaxID=207710 RepID=UPI0010A3BC52|nr:MLP-like protein 28 [Prosopis alba]XP_028798326.1 MLP-like protein 28 [Prosopis alba]
MVSTLEADVELQTSALKFLEIFSTKTYKLATISPDIIQSLEIIGGDWGTAGFSFLVHYTVEGTAQVAKEVVESINLIERSITFKVIEGDLLDVYNSFRFILKITPNVLSGSVVHWTLEYEKPSDDTADPTSLMKEVIQVSKDVDAFVSGLI